MSDSSFNDYVEVEAGLFLGSHPEPEDAFDLGADVVVCLAAGSSSRAVEQDGLLVHWPIKDGPVPHPETLRALARLVATCLDNRQVVYLHCMAGMNRSALVACRVLMELGMTPDDAIRRVRERRHGALSDEYAAWQRSEDMALEENRLARGR